MASAEENSLGCMNKRYVSGELVLGQVGLVGTAEKSGPAGVIMVQVGSFDPDGCHHSAT